MIRHNYPTCPDQGGKEGVGVVPGEAESAHQARGPAEDGVSIEIGPIEFPGEAAFPGPLPKKLETARWKLRP